MAESTKRNYYTKMDGIHYPKNKGVKTPRKKTLFQRDHRPSRKAEIVEAVPPRLLPLIRTEKYLN